MDQSIAKPADRLQGSLSCFDRVLFRGYLPFFSGYAMASFLEMRKVHRRDVKRFVLTQAYRLKDHARQLAQHGVRYTKHDNAFLWVEDFARAQRLADRFVSLPWVARLDRYARQVNPVLRDGLTPMQDSWVTTQAEYA